MPYPISAVRVQAIYGTVPRLNYDKSITPTLLIHAGVGYQRFHNPDSSPPQVLQYDAVGQLGIRRQRHQPGGLSRAFNGLERTIALGPSNANSYFDGTFTAVASATWVHGNHTSKLGGEYRLTSWTDRNSRGAQGILNFSANETGDPFNNTNSFTANGVPARPATLRQLPSGPGRHRDGQYGSGPAASQARLGLVSSRTPGRSRAS